MKKVVVIGLGIMGHGIADNFLKNGYVVTVWNRSSEKADDLVKQGAHFATSIKEAVQSSDIVFEVTANDQSSQKVWDDILSVARPEQYFITCATLSVKWTDELAKKCQDANLTFFDTPMTGGRIAAESGQLTLLVGGDKDKLSNIKEVLTAITKDIKLFGKVGAGMRYKLILNTLQAIHIAGLGEALRMADAVGLDKELVGEALVERPGGVITNIGWQSYKEDPNPITFSVEWIAKDLAYAAEMAKTINHPMLDKVLEEYKEAIEKGFAQADWTKINKL